MSYSNINLKTSTTIIVIIQNIKYNKIIKNYQEIRTWMMKILMRVRVLR